MTSRARLPSKFCRIQRLDKFRIVEEETPSVANSLNRVRGSSWLALLPAGTSVWVPSTVVPLICRCVVRLSGQAIIPRGIFSEVLHEGISDAPSPAQKRRIQESVTFCYSPVNYSRTRFSHSSRRLNLRFWPLVPAMLLCIHIGAGAQHSQEDIGTTFPTRASGDRIS